MAAARRHRGEHTAAAAVVVAVALAALACVDTAEVAVAGAGRCVHGHSPVWDAALQRLHWVDTAGRVLSYDPAARTHLELDMLEPVGCVVPYVQHRLLVAGQEHLYSVGFQGKRGVLRRLPGHLAMVPVGECVTEVLNPEETGLKAPPGARFHSGSCDAQGRWWLSFKRTTGKCDSAMYSINAPPEWAAELDPDGLLHQVNPGRPRSALANPWRGNRLRPLRFRALTAGARRCRSFVLQYGPNAVLRERPEALCVGPCNGITWGLRHAQDSPQDAGDVSMYLSDAGSQVRLAARPGRERRTQGGGDARRAPCAGVAAGAAGGRY